MLLDLSLFQVFHILLRIIDIAARVGLLVIFLKNRPELGSKSTNQTTLWYALLATIALPIILHGIGIYRELCDPGIILRALIRFQVPIGFLSCFTMYFLLENLTRRQWYLSIVSWVLIVSNIALAAYFWGRAVLYPTIAMRSTIEETIRLGSVSATPFLLLGGLIAGLVMFIRNTKAPKIIRQKIVPSIFVPLALLLMDTPIYKHIIIPYLPYSTHLYAISILRFTTTIIFFYFIKSMIRTRFLNMSTHVTATTKLRNIEAFRNVMEKLNYVNNHADLEKLTQKFFKQSFGIQHGYVKLYTRQNNQIYAANDIATMSDLSTTEQAAENYLSQLTEDCTEGKVLLESKILNHDEIEFDHYYTPSTPSHNQLNYLDLIGADLFLPIFYDEQVSGYIVVERSARGNKLYNNIECDEMIMYAGYLSQILHLLQHKSLSTILSKQHRNIRHLQSQEHIIDQRNETIDNLVNADNSSEIGIVHYKNRKFANGNHLATTMLSIDLNTTPTHPLTKSFALIVERLRRYTQPYTVSCFDIKGKPLLITGIPTSDPAHTIIILNRPPISRELKRHQRDITHGANWQHIVALEMTKDGILINNKFPGYSKPLTVFKVALLNAALSNEPMLLELGEHDLVPAAELIHHISDLESLYTIDPLKYEDQTLLCEEIFGINPLVKENKLAPLLKRLDNDGVLFIKNVHALSEDIQRKLIEFIQSGTFTMIRSDQRISSKVHIICSSHHSADTLRKEHLLPTLHRILTKTHVRFWFKEQHHMHKVQMINHIEQMWYTAHDPYEINKLTEIERSRFITEEIDSFTELKHKMHHAMALSANPKAETPRELRNSEFETGDPLLEKAAKLGHKALKDRAVMNALWDKFHNQQKIADFLGVNRSSVSRRCRLFDIHA